MTVTAAKHIIASYGKLVGNAGEGRYFQSNTVLPCSVPRIKMAVCTYIAFLIRLKPIPTETIQSLMVAYSYLGFFVEPELAKALNALAQRHASGKQPGDELMFTLRQLNKQKEMLVREIQAYIQEEIQVHEREISPLN